MVFIYSCPPSHGTFVLGKVAFCVVGGSKPSMLQEAKLQLKAWLKVSECFPDLSAEMTSTLSPL